MVLARAEPGPAREPARVPRFAPADGADRLAGQGRGDRHRPADERGHRTGRPARPGRIVVLTGPNLAVEIALGGQPRRCWPAPTTSAPWPCRWPAPPPYFRPYTITDVIGAEIAGTGKNIIALAVRDRRRSRAGLNTAASLITRGLQRGDPAGRRSGRATRDVRRPGGSRRPGRHLLVAAVPQPKPRRAARLRHRPGGGAGSATGGQVAEGVVSCRSVRDLALPAQDRHADHRVGVPGLLPPPAADPDDQLPDGPADSPE